MYKVNTSSNYFIKIGHKICHFLVCEIRDKTNKNNFKILLVWPHRISLFIKYVL